MQIKNCYLLPRVTVKWVTWVMPRTLLFYYMRVGIWGGMLLIQGNTRKFSLSNIPPSLKHWFSLVRLLGECKGFSLPSHYFTKNLLNIKYVLHDKETLYFLSIFTCYLWFYWKYIVFCFVLFCSEFCHTLKWKGLGFTCLPHPDPPSHLPLHPLPPGLPRAPGPSACLMHPIWAGDLFHPW